MEYVVSKLAKMAGLTSRTLRFYDETGLLKPARITSCGYRVYGQAEVDKLQQILFYREIGLPLADIAKIMNDPDFDAADALEGHLRALKAKRQQIDTLIANAEKTIGLRRGENTMTDEEKFEGMKEKLIAENEEEYGAEIREKYGEQAVEKSNAKVRAMTQEDQARLKELQDKLTETLRAACMHGDPASPEAQKACALHKEWLGFFWDTYSKGAHKGLGELYAADDRFKVYYEKIAPGCAEFLRDALAIFCE